jgi:flagellar protein FliS
MLSQRLAYQQNSVTTAPPEKLVLMLYDGALRFIAEGKGAIERGELSRANASLGNAQKILNELRIGLNLQAGEIAGNLERLYEYINYRLIQANIKKDPQILTEVAELLSEIRAAWAQGVCRVK